MFVSKLKYWEQYRVKVNLKIQQVEFNVVLLSIQESVQVTIWACFFSITCNWCKYFLHIFIAALCEFSGSTEHSCYSELYLTFKRIFKLQITSHSYQDCVTGFLEMERLTSWGCILEGTVLKSSESELQWRFFKNFGGGLLILDPWFCSYFQGKRLANFHGVV